MMNFFQGKNIGSKATLNVSPLFSLRMRDMTSFSLFALCRRQVVVISHQGPRIVEGARSIRHSAIRAVSEKTERTARSLCSLSKK